MVPAVESRYNVFIALSEGRKLAYNAYSEALSLLEPTDIAAFDKIVVEGQLDPTDPVMVELARGGFVVPRDVDELELLETEYRKMRYEARHPILTVMTTTSCNFGCDYCFQGADKPHEVMGPEVRAATAKWVQDLAEGGPEGDGPGITGFGAAWYGGEPLLKPEVIDDLSARFVAIAEAHKVRYEAGIVTNGWYLDAKMAKRLYAGQTRWAQVTLDGYRREHDGRRHLLGGQKTFDRLVDNVCEVVETDTLRISIRVNIDARNQEGIYELIDELAAKGLAGKPNFGLYFAPVEALTDGCHNVADVTMTKDHYGDLEAKLYRYGLSKRIVGLPYPKRFHGVCGAVRPQGVVIMPNGDVHKCWDTVSMPHYKVGTIFEPEKLAQHPMHKRWMDWTPFTNETCRNCKILPTCAGSCAYKFVHATHTRGEAATLPCPSWKYNLAERLLVTAEARGVITVQDRTEQTLALKPSDLCTDDFRPGEALPENMMTLLGQMASKSQPRLRVVP